jgi:hypothetical protein
VTARSWARRLLDEVGHRGLPVPSAPAGEPLADWAESGAASLTGCRDGSPIVPPGGAATAARGAGLALTALSEVLGHPIQIQGHHLLGERAALARLDRCGPWNPTRTCRAVRARDGWLALNLARPDDVRAVPALIEAEPGSSAWSGVRSWARGMRAADAAERAQILGLAAGAIPRHAKPPVPVPRYERVTVGEPHRRPPLVVDLSALWAGPLCAHLLGLAGARVVKVEAPNRLDGVRDGCPSFFELLNGRHEAVLLRIPADRDRLLRLLDHADIVITSARPRAIAQLGLDPLAICRRSATTWVSITAYDRKGPWANRVGFGDDVAMTAGLVVRRGNAAPLPCGDAIADPLTGLHAAVGALGSYLHGGSGLVDVAMHDVVSASMSIGLPCSVQSARGGCDWWIPTRDGAVPIARPRTRPATGRAPRPGENDQEWP